MSQAPDRRANVSSADGGELGGVEGGFDGGSGSGPGSGVGSPPPPDEQATRSAMVVRSVRIRGIGGSNRKNDDISTIHDYGWCGASAALYHGSVT